ncbi:MULTISPECIES: efflux RND transporter periplasmic adaptor subunit [unclassified Pseudomonas]|uniref:efflux RND transporter periplasmic adaptor subunit n=1 Tax=unclassified Pseudomonas TaxID=196821 RepID=UPI00048339F9|nr:MULTISPECIES: efflux RND transporter periplasmic adaptor subunit [unclassified Pseudomonas]PXX64539.1 membrane fusion protein (multidrug efflux system) [Pseudomonas sp. LAIL14HWK12:I1]SMD12345.1 membrane fusion protein, multidrug efflux system [Pseudomonas sp. URIL14HWK12:I5]SOC98443.1 membrane fusion protein, multidrug efflux system [Pseudomonas sp. LAIL14HWK12:I3]
MRRPTNLWIPLLFPLSGMLLLSACNAEAPHTAAQPVEVGVYTVQAAPLTLTTDLPGRTTAFRVAEVRPQVNGVLQQRLFVEGSEVKKGQQLYQIDARTYLAQQARAEANLHSAKNLAERYERLLQTKAISRQQRDDAVSAWKQAEADKRVADINVQYTKVLSPISGRIGRSAVTEGALMTEGQTAPMATVNQLDPIYVDVTQPITRILALKRALKSGDLVSAGEDQAQVNLTLDDGSVYPLAGTLKFSEVSVDQGTGSVTLRAVFPNPDRALLPGMFVHAQLKEGVKERAMIVPQQAVTRDSRGVATVWVVKPDGRLEHRDLSTVRTVGNGWLIDGGLEPGEKIITEGLQRVNAESVVKATPARNVNLGALAVSR